MSGGGEAVAKVPAWRRARRWIALKSLHWSVRSVIGPGLIVVGGLFNDLFPAKVPVVAAGLVVTTVSAVSSDRYDKALARARTRQDAQAQISRTLQTAVTYIESASTETTGEGRTLRAAVFLPDTSGAGLKMAYFSEGFTPDERELVWGQGQGVVGQAWESGVATIAPKRDELPVSLEQESQPTRPWGMSAAQVRVTAGRAAAVYAVPVNDKGRVTAVLAVDDTRRLPESPISIPEVRELIAEHLLVSLRELLGQADWSSPEVQEGVS